MSFPVDENVHARAQQQLIQLFFFIWEAPNARERVQKGVSHKV